MDLWTKCRETAAPVTVAGDLIRVVENQEQIATKAIVDTLEEQAALEALLEQNKPALRAGTEGKHYLLSTPFRYLPLPCGSRFGRRHERGICYGSKCLETALAELAYYRLVFINDAVSAMTLARSQHTAFQVSYRSPAAIRLQDPPCSEYETVLCSQSDYAATQALGSALCAEGYNTIEYKSARDASAGINIALIDPIAIVSQEPHRMRALFCETTPESVTVSDTESHRVFLFRLDEFLENGIFPTPAV